ncbi:hypothetical protein HG530_014523 [Fusarium avenaceum]|nr:hypothetical protein HG530_014523 [Fusarium avenaceum]
MLVVVEPERVFYLGGLGVVDEHGGLAGHVEHIAGRRGETLRFGGVDGRYGAFALLVVVKVWLSGSVYGKGEVHVHLVKVGGRSKNSGGFLSAGRRLRFSSAQSMNTTDLGQRDNPLLDLGSDVSCEVSLVSLAPQRLSKETPSRLERVEVEDASRAWMSCRISAMLSMTLEGTPDERYASLTSVCS